MFSLHNKKAIITGAGSGIGRAIALLFAAQSADVYLIDIHAESLEETRAAIEAAGGKATIYVADVTKITQVTSAFTAIQSAHILVNCAGIAHVGNAVGTSPEDFDRIYQVNVKGVYHCLHAGIPVLLKAGGGAILNLASIAGITGIPDRFAYSMSKGAILSMTLSVAKDFIKNGIRCNCISPARVHTPFVDGFIEKHYPGKEHEMFEKLSATQPIGRMGEPDEVAALAYYLSSKQASFITGSDYPLDGGFTRLNN